MKVLKHGIYFSEVADKIVHCHKCQCLFRIEMRDDIRLNDHFDYHVGEFVKSIDTICPECGTEIRLVRGLESEKIDGGNAE